MVGGIKYSRSLKDKTATIEVINSWVVFYLLCVGGWMDGVESKKN